MKNKILAIILTITLLCSAFSMFANAESLGLGDVNNDKKVNASDARLTLRAAANLEKFTADQKVAADINFDNKVNAADARIILRIAAQLQKMPEKPTQETTKPTTTQPSTEKPTQAAKVEYPEAIDAFFSGKYYIEAVVGEGDEAAVMKMAVSDKGFEMASDLELFEGMGKMELSIMQLSKTFYIKYPDANGKKKVFVIDEETAKSIESSFGVDISELFETSLFEEMNLIFKPKSETPVHKKGEYKGQECDIYVFDVEEGKIAFYTIGEEVKTINIIDAEGNEGTAMEVLVLTEKIPGKMLKTSGYKKVGMGAFIADLMAMVPQE